MDKPRRLRSTFGVRLAGAALCTAGLAFIGYGTVNGPAKSMLGLTGAPACAAETECVKASQVPTNVANSTCSSTDIPGNSAPDNTDSWWHFVVPSDQNWVFTGSGFTASFTGGTIENITFVQPRTGGYKGVVVEADGGATLTNAYVTDAGTTETVELEGTGPEGGDFVLSNSCGGGTTSSTTATVSTTKTVTAPGTTVTTTVSGPTTTTTAPGTTNTTTKTVSTSTTMTVPTTVTNNTTATNTVTTTKTNTATTTVTASGTTVTVTTTVPTTATAATTVTSNHTATTTVTAPTTVTAGTTITNTGTATTTKTVTTGSAASPASSTTSSSSSSSSTPTSGVAAATTTPSTGAGSDLAFGTGLALLVAGGGLIAGATRITRRKRN